MNNINCWGNDGFATNTENLLGCIGGLYGNFKNIRGRASRINANALTLSLVTNDLDDIQELIKKYKISVIHITKSNVYYDNKEKEVCLLIAFSINKLHNGFHLYYKNKTQKELFF